MARTSGKPEQAPGVSSRQTQSHAQLANGIFKKWFNIIYRENIGHAYVHFTYVYAAPQTNELRVLYPRKWVEFNEEIYLKYIKVHRWQSQ